MTDPQGVVEDARQPRPSTPCRSLSPGSALDALRLTRPRRTPCHTVTAGDLAPMALAWAVYFLVNNLIVSGVLAAYAGEPFWAVFSRTSATWSSRTSPSWSSPRWSPSPCRPASWWLPLAAAADVRRSTRRRPCPSSRSTRPTTTPSPGCPTASTCSRRWTAALGGGAARAQGRRCSCSTSTGSRRSTTPSATSTGDHLLEHVAERLREARCGPRTWSPASAATSSRCCCPTSRTREAALEVAARIQAALAEPFRLEGMLLELEASVGIALYPDHGADVRAAAALGRRRHVPRQGGALRCRGLHAPTRTATRTTRLGLLGVAAPGRSTTASSSCTTSPRSRSRPAPSSASRRWCAGGTRTRGLIFPDEFVPLAEQLRTHAPAHRARRRHRARAGRARGGPSGWRSRSRSTSPPATCTAPALAETVASGLARHGLPAAALRLELTERVLMSEPGPGGRHPGRARAAGRAALASTTSGPGTPRWCCCSGCRCREIKVDRSFVKRLTTSPRRREDRPLDHRPRARPGHRGGGRGRRDRGGLGHCSRTSAATARRAGTSAGPMPAERATEWLLRHPSRSRALRILQSETPIASR